MTVSMLLVIRGLKNCCEDINDLVIIYPKSYPDHNVINLVMVFRIWTVPCPLS